MTPTERIYYHDAYARHFDATAIAADGRKLYLDRTAFYPTSGGQPFDRGTIAGVAVEEVIDEGERIAHLVAGPVPGGPVRCDIDWTRRFDFMQQHTGQHLLSAVLAELFGFSTLSVHFGDEISTVDIAAPALHPEQLAGARNRVNELVFENRPVTVSFAEGSGDLGLRKASDREGVLRVIAIDGIDRSACGGTHVRSTAEIGPVLIRKLDKIRGSVRIEFLCGMRAVRRAAADYEALSAIGRLLSAPVDETPALVRAQADRTQDLEKSRKKMASELAAYQGRELYEATAPDAAGLRRVVLREPITDDLRARAASFTALPRALMIVITEEPPSVLVAASKDSGVNAGEMVKAAVTAKGGRGGGSPLMAQGSVPSRADLEGLFA